MVASSDLPRGIGGGIEGRVARLALLDLPARVEGLEREDAETMITGIREVGGSAELAEP